MDQLEYKLDVYTDSIVTKKSEVFQIFGQKPLSHEAQSYQRGYAHLAYLIQCESESAQPHHKLTNTTTQPEEY